MNADNTNLDSLSEKVLGAVFEVSNTLRPDSSKKLPACLASRAEPPGLRATTEVSFAVIYKGHSVGEYFEDLLVEDALVVELKCAERLAAEHTAQCLNYLQASCRTVCLLVNFHKPKVEWKRIVLGFADPLKPLA